MNLDETIDFSGVTEVAIRNTEVKAPGIKKLAETYDEHAKIAFIFDVSGSMSSGLEYVAGEKNASKMELVKRLAKRELEARFKKHPNSRVAVVVFGSSARVVFDDGAPDSLWSILDKLRCGYGGVNDSDTNILDGISKAMDACRKHPSPVGIHHFVMVSDGGDHRTCNLPAWTPALKASGVVLDYIHLGSAGSVNEHLRRACEALGGECVEVTNAQAFEERFLAAVNRLMLPAPE